MATYADKLKDPRWQKKRLEILQRDDFQCQMCGTKQNTLHVHHIAYSVSPWDIDNRLLITLCEECHEREEKNLKVATSQLIEALRVSGFMSMGMYSLADCFKEKDRGWSKFDPCFSILELLINDDTLWELASELYWARLAKQNIVKKSVV